MSLQIQLSLRTYLEGEQKWLHVEHFKALPQCRWYCVPIHFVLGILQAIPLLGYAIFKLESRVVRWLHGIHSIEAICTRVEKANLFNDPAIPQKWKDLAENSKHKLGFILHVLHTTQNQSVEATEERLRNFLEYEQTTRFLETGSHSKGKISTYIETVKILAASCFRYFPITPPKLGGVQPVAATYGHDQDWLNLSPNARLGEVLPLFLVNKGVLVLKVLHDGKESYLCQHQNTRMADLGITPGQHIYVFG